MNNQHMYNPWIPMGMQANQSQSSMSPMMAQQNGPQQMGMPPWASQMGPQQPPMAPPPGMPPPMATGQAAMTPPINPIDTQVAGMKGSEGMGGPPAASMGPGQFMGAANMAMGMLDEGDAQQVVSEHRQMAQQGLSRMQQIAAKMRQRQR